MQLEDAHARLEEFEEHVQDLQEEGEVATKRIKELESMVLDGKKHINSLLQQMLEKDRALSSRKAEIELEELIQRLEESEKRKLDQDLVLLDLREEHARLERMAQATNSALLRAEEEVEALRASSSPARSMNPDIARYEATLRQQQQVLFVLFFFQNIFF